VFGECVREHDAAKKSASVTTKIWSAAANPVRRRFGLFGVAPLGGEIPRKRGTPNRATLRFAGPFQIDFAKYKIPSPSAGECDRLRQDFPEGQFPLLPEYLFAGIQKLQQRPGRSPGFVVA
jgi:hypothetical protein